MKYFICILENEEVQRVDKTKFLKVIDLRPRKRGKGRSLHALLE